MTQNKVLILFVSILLAWGMTGCQDNETASAQSRSAENVPETHPVSNNTGVAGSSEDDVEVAVYYFHGNRRCRSCLVLESACQKAVETGFIPEIASGKVSWSAVNTDLEDNRFYVDEFELTFSSVIVARYESGTLSEWKNLPNVWRLTRDEDKMMEYVQQEVQTFLE
jgi:hypothetical protein